MGDNVTYTNRPSGVPAETTISTDEVDGKHMQRVKLDVGGDGVSVPVTDLATSANQTPTPTGINGGPVTVGTSAVEMTFTGTTKVIAIKSASTNTGLIWFGPATVDNTGANAYGELTADAAVEIELDDAAAAVYAVSDTAAQKVYKAGLT